MDQGKRKLATALLAGASLITAATSAHAVFLPSLNYAEVGDAGQTLGTAANAGAFPGGASTITGTIGTTSDADLYLFTLSAATNLQFTVTTPLNGIDGALFLFNSTGQALFANDDTAFSLNPTLNAGLLPAGQYYLGISLSGNEPVNSVNQLLFATGTSTSTRGAAAGVNPTTLSNFNSGLTDGVTGTYGIAITAVPEPSTNAALALGALGSFVLLRRFRRSQTA